LIAGDSSISFSPCWIASQAEADGRPLAIVWFANQSSNLSLAQSLSLKNAASHEDCTVSHIDAISGCASKPSLRASSCAAAGAVTGEAEP